MSHFELINIESTIRMEIMNGCNQKTVAKTIALGIVSSEEPDWEAINKMIIHRWSPHGRERIFNIAWKMIDDKRGGS